jgi:hypothetical protein
MEEVVRDLRQTVFAVVRLQPAGPSSPGMYRVIPAGSGFFVSPRAFVTAYHVVNPPDSPHQDGEFYELANNLVSGVSVGGAQIRTPQIVLGQNLHLFHDLDLAIVVLDPPAGVPICYATPDYQSVLPGREIGIAGYPLPKVDVAADKLVYSELRFRVARGTVTSAYHSPLLGDSIQINSPLPVIEVNFLFVPGNSGGPAFDVETGRVLGYVHGYRSPKIGERVEDATLIKNPPPDVATKYVLGVTAVYSLAIEISAARSALESFRASS